VEDFERESVTRAEFIKRMMDAGLNYDQAKIAWKATLATIEDAIVQGRKIILGHVASIAPKMMPPRAVNYGFNKSTGNRKIYLGKRIRFRFRIFPRFLKTHELNWLP